MAATGVPVAVTQHIGKTHSQLCGWSADGRYNWLGNCGKGTNCGNGQCQIYGERCHPNQLGQVGWFAHIVNLPVCRAFKVGALSHTLPRAWKLVGHFSRRPGTATILKENQELLELPVQKLIQKCTHTMELGPWYAVKILDQQATVFAAVLVALLSPGVRQIPSTARTKLSFLR